MDVEKGTRQLKSLIEKLERNNRTLRSHPTIEKIERGELSQAQLRHWATQLFIGNKAHNANILGLIYAKCDDFPGAQSDRRESDRRGTRPRLRRQSIASRALSRIRRGHRNPARRIAQRQHDRRRHRDDALDVLAGRIEAVVRDARRHQPRLRALQPRRLRPRDRRAQPHYKLSDDALLFFSVHVKVDKDHGDSSAGSIFRAIPESAAAETLWAVETHIELMRRLWSDINPPLS